jgi:hypothetical protein
MLRKDAETNFPQEFGQKEISAIKSQIFSSLKGTALKIQFPYKMFE